jgi:hypothetical protein
VIRLWCWLVGHRECDAGPLRYFEHIERRWWRITRKSCLRCDRLRVVDRCAL